MGYPGSTRTAPTTQRSSRNGQSPRMAVLHHAAMFNLDDLVRLMQPGSGRTVSAHAAIGGGEVVGTVDTAYRAWSLGDEYWDSVAVTAEIINSTGAPDWSVSAESHESAARWVAANAAEQGWWPHRSGPAESWTVIGHREVYSIHDGSYATACPGGLDLNEITLRAQQLLSPPPLPKDETMTIIKPTESWGGRPAARIITDLRYKELVTDPTRIATLDYTVGAAVIVVDEKNWKAWAARPDFPTGGAGGGYDDSRVLAAIAAGEAQDAAGLQQILTAIAGVDEATLATFGLKRA